MPSGRLQCVRFEESCHRTDEPGFILVLARRLTGFAETEYGCHKFIDVSNLRLVCTTDVKKALDPQSIHFRIC